MQRPSNSVPQEGGNRIASFLQNNKWKILILLFALIVRIWITGHPDKSADLPIQTETTNVEMGLLAGGKYDNILNLILIDNLDQTSRTEKISKAALLRYLLAQDTLDIITELEDKLELDDNEKLDRIEISKMLKVLSTYINTNDEIIEVESYQNTIQRLQDEDIFHQNFFVCKTTGSSGELYWWSLDKNEENFTIQRSTEKDAVLNKLEGNPRKAVTRIEMPFTGETTVYDFLQLILVDNIVEDSSHVIDFLNSYVRSQQSTPIVKGIDEFYPTEIFEFSSWPPLVALILMNKSELLVTACQKEDCDINGNYNKVTPLNYAILFSQTQMVDFLLNKLHADPTNCDDRGKCPLQIASSLPQKEIIELLLNTEQVHVNDQNQLGYTALHVAARKSNVMMARYLLENGANPEVYSHLNKTPIQLAAQLAINTQIMDELLKFYDINIRTDTNQNLLHLAASQSNALTTRYLIEKGVDPNAFTNENVTPLHYAASFGNDEVIDLLLNTGKVNIEARDSLIGRTPLQHAIVISNIQAVCHLLAKGANPKVRDDLGQSTPLDLAAIFGSDVELIDLLLETGKVHVSDSDKDGHTALHWAAKESNLLMARYLIEKGADPIAMNMIGATPLHFAAYFGEKTDVIELLLANEKISIDKRDVLEMRPLHSAAINSNSLTVGYLIEKGADIKAVNSFNHTAFHTAAQHAERKEVIDEFLKYLKVDYRTNTGETPLHLAVIKSNPITTRYLIEKGANLKARDINGNSPLDLAAMWGKNTEILDILLETGKVNVNDRNEETGLTALHRAAFKSNAFTTRYLIEKGANPNAVNTYDNNALHVAARFAENTEIIDVLLGHINVEKRADLKRTALHYAIIQSNILATRHLIKRGADPNARDSAGLNSLFYAVIVAKDLEIINLLLDQQVYIFGEDEEGNNLLYFVNLNADMSMVKSIINLLIKRLGYEVMNRLKD